MSMLHRIIQGSSGRSGGRFSLLRIISAARKSKGHEEIRLDRADMELLVEIREAFEKKQREKPSTPTYFASRTRWAQEEEPEEGKKRTGPPPHWEEFLEAKYEGGKKLVENSNPKTKDSFPKVRVTTRMKTDQAFMKKIMEEYRRWLGERDAKPSNSGKPGISFGVKFPEGYPYQEKIRLDEKTSTYLRENNVDVKDLLDAAGFSALQGQSYNRPFVHMDEGVLKVESNLYDEKAPVQVVSRQFDFKSKTVKNDVLMLGSDAPKGLGTKILTSQIEKAREMGMKRMVCTAYREDPRFVGYKVWPRLGYDGPIPVEKTGLPKKYQDALSEAGHLQPYRIQQLFSLGKDAIQWWDEHGDTFEAEFDLEEDSPALQIFHAYVEKKGGYAKLAA